MRAHVLLNILNVLEKKGYNARLAELFFALINSITQEQICEILFIIRASRQENLSLGFPTKSNSNQPAQLQRLARKMKFCL